MVEIIILLVCTITCLLIADLPPGLLGVRNGRVRITTRRLMGLVAVAAILFWHVVSEQHRFLDQQIARLSGHIELAIQEQKMIRYFKPHGPDCNCPACLNEPRFASGIKMAREYEAQIRAARDAAIARRRSWWPW